MRLPGTLLNDAKTLGILLHGVAQRRSLFRWAGNVAATGRQGSILGNVCIAFVWSTSLRIERRTRRFFERPLSWAPRSANSGTVQLFAVYAANHNSPSRSPTLSPRSAQWRHPMTAPNDGTQLCRVLQILSRFFERLHASRSCRCRQVNLESFTGKIM